MLHMYDRAAKFLVLITMIGFSSLSDAQISNDNSLLPGSLATKDQIFLLQQLALELKVSEYNLKGLPELNSKLKEMNLPEIDLQSPSLKVRTVDSPGFDIVAMGARVDDGKHRYCLPCPTSEHGVFKYGINLKTHSVKEMIWDWLQPF